MIRNQELKNQLEMALENLNQSYENMVMAGALAQSLSYKADAIRIVTTIQRAKREIEDILYPPEYEDAVFELVTDEKTTVFRETNHL